MSEERKKRTGYVALIGRPNVGKSTLLNHIIGMKLAITSRLPQTTRKKMMAVYTSDRGQIVFMDTPGIHLARNKLGEYMDSSAYKTLESVDSVLFLAEPKTYIGAGERHILEELSKIHLPVFLVVNKIDMVKKAEIPPVIAAYKEIFDFAGCFPVSAKHKTGVDVLINRLYDSLPEGDPFFDEDTITNETEREIISELVREQALRQLSEEVPHGVAVDIESMKRKRKIWHIEATIYCEKKSHKGIIIGRNGDKIKSIGMAARAEIEKLLSSQVNLQLWVKVRPNWRDDEKIMRNLGYDLKDIS